MHTSMTKKSQKRHLKIGNKNVKRVRVCVWNFSRVDNTTTHLLDEVKESK